MNKERKKNTECKKTSDTISYFFSSSMHVSFVNEQRCEQHVAWAKSRVPHPYHHDKEFDTIQSVGRYCKRRGKRRGRETRIANLCTKKKTCALSLQHTYAPSQ